MLGLYTVIAYLLSVVAAVQVFPSDRQIDLQEFQILKGNVDIPTVVLDLSEYYYSTELNTPGSIFKYIFDGSSDVQIPEIDIEYSTRLVNDEDKMVQAFKPKKTTDAKQLSNFVKQVYDSLLNKYGIVPTFIIVESSDNEERGIVDDIESNVEELLDDIGVLDFLEDHEGQDSDSDSGSDSDDKNEEHRIWTEGLLMCLIVSFILLGVLVIALSWLSSLSISYGALERQTAPSKKTN